MSEKRRDACLSEIAALPPGQDSTAPERGKGTLVARDGRGLRPDSTGKRASIFASLRWPLPAQLDASNFNKMTNPIPSNPSQHADWNSSRHRPTAKDAKDSLKNFSRPNGATHISLGQRPRFPAPQSNALKGRPIKRQFKPSIPNSFTQGHDLIAHILGTQDDKMELKRRINATLEAMARALFQSWFIDLEPVRRNAARFQNQPSPQPYPNGRGRSAAEGEGASGIRNAEGGTPHPEDSLFPDSFEDSTVGEFPQGWTVEPVGNVVDCLGDGTPRTKRSKFWKDGIHQWTTPKDFSSLQSPILIDTSHKLTNVGIAKTSSGVLPAGTLILSSRAPVGYLAISAIPVAINQVFIAMKCNDGASNYFMLNWCQSNIEEIKSRASGTTFPQISKNNFRSTPVVLPSKELVTEFTAKVAPLCAQITASLYQSRTLSHLRDVLLPKLISGSNIAK